MIRIERSENTFLIQFFLKKQDKGCSWNLNINTEALSSFSNNMVSTSFTFRMLYYLSDDMEQWSS